MSAHYCFSYARICTMYVALPSLSHSKSRTCRLSFSRSHTYTLDSTHRKLASIHLWPVGIITLLHHSWDNTKLGFTFERMLAFIEYWSRVLVANYYILNNRVWFFELWKNPSKGDTTRSTAVCPEASVIQGGGVWCTSVIDMVMNAWDVDHNEADPTLAVHWRGELVW